MYNDSNYFLVFCVFAMSVHVGMCICAVYWYGIRLSVTIAL